MAITLEQIHQDVKMIKYELDEIKDHIFEDDLELSDETLADLEEARKTPISEHISHEQVKKSVLNDI